MSTPPELPHVSLEVAENVIDQLSWDVRSLRSCALTCREWHPRARFHLMTSIRVQSRDDLFTIGDYFDSNPHLIGLVRNLSIAPVRPGSKSLSLLEAVPVPLLSRFPNLRSYSMRFCFTWDGNDKVHGGNCFLSFHATALGRIKTYLNHIEDLTLGTLGFGTTAELARLLIALPCLRRLECTHLRILNRRDDWPSPNALTQLRNRCGRLTEVTVQETELHVLRLITQMASSALAVLRCDMDADAVGWARIEAIPVVPPLESLCSLEVSLPSRSNELTWVLAHLTQIVNTSVPRTLRTLRITFTGSRARLFFARAIEDQEQLQQCRLLEDAILTLQNPRVTVSILQEKRKRLWLWSDLISECFPHLHERKILQVECSSAGTDGKYAFGHDAATTAIAVSPDGRYVATGATDRTVKIWSRAEQVPTCLIELQTTDSCVTSLVFSNTGEFLAGMKTIGVLIWRVADGSHITSFGGPEWNLSCAWARDSLDHLSLFSEGTSIHSYRRSGHLRITKARVQPSCNEIHNTSAPPSSSYHQIMDLEYSEGLSGQDLIVQSSSGRLIAAAVRSGPRVCYIWWMVDSAPTYEVRQLTYSRTDQFTPPESATFAGDDRFVVGFADGSIRWWDIFVSPLTTTGPHGVLVPGCQPVSILTVSPRNSFLIALRGYLSSVPVLVHAGNFKAHGRTSVFSSTSYTFLDGHTGSVRAMCISPCERYIATASDDTTVRLWSARDGSLVWTFVDHDAPVTHILFTPDGRTLVSADRDGEVCMHVLSRFVRDPPLPPMSADEYCMRSEHASG